MTTPARDHAVRALRAAAQESLRQQSDTDLEQALSSQIALILDAAVALSTEVLLAGGLLTELRRRNADAGDLGIPDDTAAALRAAFAAATAESQLPAHAYRAVAAAATSALPSPLDDEPLSN